MAEHASPQTKVVQSVREAIDCVLQGKDQPRASSVQAFAFNAAYCGVDRLLSLTEQQKEQYEGYHEPLQGLQPVLTVMGTGQRVHPDMPGFTMRAMTCNISMVRCSICRPRHFRAPRFAKHQACNPGALTLTRVHKPALCSLQAYCHCIAARTVHKDIPANLCACAALE